MFYFFFRERRREEERERNNHVREKHLLVPSSTPPTGDLAPKPGMWPDWESNRSLLVWFTGLRSIHEATLARDLSSSFNTKGLHKAHLQDGTKTRALRTDLLLIKNIIK